MTHKISLIFLISCLCLSVSAQIPQPIKQLLRKPYMEGASFSLIVKDIQSGEAVFAFDTIRQLTPASVMKTVTTATALELLGEDYRYPTTLEYEGTVEGGVLNGNLYIKGSGDPSLGSAHFDTERGKFIHEWIGGLKKAGIHAVKGAVIADESVFDTEGISMKWVGEDMGSYYGAGSYGLSVFDNLYKLFLRTGEAGSRPQVIATEPEMNGLRFHNYLTARPVSSDSSYIAGMPFATDRYLYGILPANRQRYQLKGDIPDPALFLAEYFTKALKQEGITVGEPPSCYRILHEAGEWKAGGRTEIITTFSPTLKEIVEVTNHVSHNLFADALIKTIGLRYIPREGEVISSFGRGIKVLLEHWREKGLDLSSVWMYDGSGLAVTNKLSTAFMADLLIYMRNHSQASEAFLGSLPRAGQEGSVRNFLKGTHLQGKARLKSGSMSRVKGYAGYVQKDGKQYAIALFVNNYSCDGRPMTVALERLLTQLFNP